jgi:endonuclease-3 related protein
MNKLREIYSRLYRAFGPQHWWPGDTPFEISVGAILTQNTNWGNVEKAIRNLRKNRALSANAIHKMRIRELSGLIRPAGYFDVKAKRLRSFVDFVVGNYGGSLNKMGKEDMYSMREKLLEVNGVGPETADSILLYALEKPIFVIDAYTKRVLSRHGIMDHDKSYAEFQELFHSRLESDAKMFNEYHALFVRTGKTFCKRKNPLCDECPLKGV